MEINRTLRRQIRLQNASFVVLFLVVVGLLAWLSTRYDLRADWTASGRHTLAKASQQLLDNLDQPVTITAFARDLEGARTRDAIGDLVGRYQRLKADIALAFVDPDQRPDLVREYGVTLDGELVVEYAGRRENVKSPGEESITNTLQRLARSGERRVLFLAGHGERSPDGEANHDLSDWARRLEAKGFRFGRLSLSATPAVPDDTAVLVIADPRTELLAGEVQIIKEWVTNGGNLLWLSEPNASAGLQSLAAQLGIAWAGGTVVDPTGRLLGIDHPAFVVVADYPPHAVTGDMSAVTLFPFARPLQIATAEGWQGRAILRTLDRSWAETAKLEGTIAFDSGEDLAGPLTIGAALTRERAGAEGTEAHAATQRVAVIGDADFLSNRYLGNGANAELGERLLNWLSHDDAFIDIPPRTAPDTGLTLTPVATTVIGFGFLVVIPLGLLAAGGVIAWRRRKR